METAIVRFKLFPLAFGPSLGELSFFMRQYHKKLAFSAPVLVQALDRTVCNTTSRQ
jgi:hypothetical protein